jgi:hypothetical protein
MDSNNTTRDETGNASGDDLKIEIGDVAEEFYADEAELSDLKAYVAVDVTVDRKEMRVGTVVGVPDYHEGTCRAAGGGVRPFCSAWWADASDHQDVPSALLERIEWALKDESLRLYQQAMAMRHSVDGDEDAA